MKRLIRGILHKAGLELRRIKSAPIAVSQMSDELNTDIIDQIFSFYRSIPPFYDETTPAPLRIAGAWKPDLESRRRTQVGLIRAGDEMRYRELSSSMFFNELVCGVSEYGYWGELDHIPNTFLLDIERFELVTGLPADELVTNNRWSMWGLQTTKGIIKTTDPWHGLQAFNIINLLRALPPDHRRRTVLDLGSGFGGMAEKLQNGQSSSF